MMPPLMTSSNHRIRLLTSLATVAGVIAALGSLELGLRFLASPDPIPRPRILADSLRSPEVARGQVEEGVAISHYSMAGARETGNPPADQGVIVVILGDSYVLAREVADKETMGSQLERTARANGIPLDVRQYGWSGASPAQYLRVAHDVLTRWHPRRVVIPLSENDFDMESVMKAWPRLRVDSRGNARIVGPPMDTVTPGSYSSSLWMLAQHRWTLLRRLAPRWARPGVADAVGGPTLEALLDSGPPPDLAELKVLPGAVVRALAKSYGHSLTLIYMAEVGVTGGVDPSPTETRFLDACQAAGVSCASTRGDMLQARRDGIVAHGVSTITIGHGHLNPRGHGVVAAAMWKTLVADAALADEMPHR